MILDILKEIDFFGKLPEFYIKGKQKQVTILGRVLTILFIFIYIIIIIYKLYRVFKRIDITFYDSYSNTDEKPIVHLTKENFSLIFAVYDDSFLPYIDESIYYPVAHFNGEEKKEIEIKRCDFDKIGSKYKKFFSSSELNNYYCLDNVDFILKPYENSIVFQLFPCKNTTENNNNCKPKELIEEFINFKYFKILFEDLLITPTDYDNPIKERLNFLDTVTYNDVGQYIYTEMQLVRIETSTNIIGFDFLSNPKINEFIKFDNVEIIPYPGFNLNDETNENPICYIEFVLNDKILLEKKQYPQLIDVLGEVGGLMEIINSLFGIICSFFGDIFYEKEIVNSLFLFDTKRKIISIKKGNDSSFKIVGNGNINIIKNMNNSITFLNTIKKNRNNSGRNKTFIMETNIIDLNDKKSGNYLMHKRNIKKEDKMESCEISLKDNSKNSSKNLFETNKNYKNKFRPKNKYSYIIDNLNFNDIFMSKCYYFNRKRKIKNILLNEGMNIISEKLDIFNIFRNMCLIENINNNSKYDFGIFQMSEECTNSLSYIKINKL